MADNSDMSNVSMLDLFRMEVDSQCAALNERLLTLEANPTEPKTLEALMRSAHSVKGAARLVGVDGVVQIAHVMEDAFVAAQNGELVLNPDGIDALLRAVDAVCAIAKCPDAEVLSWAQDHPAEHRQLIDAIKALREGDPPAAAVAQPTAGPATAPPAAPPKAAVQAKPELADESMMALFRTEVEDQCKSLSAGLLDLEDDPAAVERLEALMRAAHSVKGAARLVGVNTVVSLAHVMEDVFVAAQNGELVLNADQMDVLLCGVDTITSIAAMNESELLDWEGSEQPEFTALISEVGSIKSGGGSKKAVPAKRQAAKPQQTASSKAGPSKAEQQVQQEAAEKDRVLRVTAERWNHLMGLAGEVKVEAGWLHPYIGSMSQLKRRQIELVEILDAVRELADDTRADPQIHEHVIRALHKAADCRKLLADQMADLDGYDRRISNLSSRLHRETIATRMRPFSDGVHGFQRMVRDIARSLGKQVRLEINGLSTQVDRDVLEKMEAPLNHLLRNALDHGVEPPEVRLKADKPEQATIRVTAMHSEGMLSILVEDDGRGIDLNRLRQKVVEKGQVTAEMAQKLSDEELLEFLYLPSFSTRDEVTDISGRGVGLDVVLDTIQKMHGTVRTTTKLGEGTRFHMQVPLTLSVMSTLIVEIAGEPYAFPLARIIRAVKVSAGQIEVLEDHQYATIDGQHIGLVGAAQVFGLGGQLVTGDELPIVIVGDQHNSYGVVVDRLIGQRELAIQSISKRLGKIQDVSAAALLEDGSPVLIVDVDDLVITVEKLIKGGRLSKVRRESGHDAEQKIKHILVVDDSLTVREVERNMLEAAGYAVDVAVDGVDGWNALRAHRHYSMVITDIDMPRMDGFELVRNIKADKNLSHLPVVIVSYKERAEDRRRGLDAGADYYLTKGSFHDNTLLEAVHDLIGEANA